MNRAQLQALALLAAGVALAASGSSGASEVAGVADAHGAQPNATGTPALHTDSCTVSIQVPNVHVASSNTYVVYGTLTQACDAGDATWDMNYQGNQRIDLWWFYSSPGPLVAGQKEGANFYSGSSPLGMYEADPSGGYDVNYQSITQNTSQFYIKVDSRITISAFRARNVVYIRARVRRFAASANFGLGGWVNSPGRTVVFYQSRGGWSRFGARSTGGNGYTSYLKFYAPTRRSFRATVTSTPTIWDRTSTATSR